MITPVNGHILIEPVEHRTFMSSEKQAYEEVGTVIGIPDSITGDLTTLKKGDKIFFDSWLAAKYPVEGSDSKFFWLVDHKDVRAVKRHEEISE